MIVTKSQLAQAAREALYVSRLYLVRKDKTTAAETEPIRKKCEDALALEVRRLLKKLDPNINPPDITNLTEVNECIEALSRRNFRAGYTT